MTTTQTFLEAERFKSPSGVLKSLEQALGKEVKLEINGWEWEEEPDWNIPAMRYDRILLEGILGQRHGDSVIITHIVGYNPEKNTDVAYVTNAVDEKISGISVGDEVVWNNPFNHFFCHQGIRTEGMWLEEYRHKNPLRAEFNVLTSPKHEATRMGGYNRFLDSGVISDLHVRYLKAPEVMKLLPNTLFTLPPTDLSYLGYRDGY